MAVWNLKHFDTLTMEDGTGTPLSCELKPGPRDLNISNLQNNFCPEVVVLDGGDFFELVEGEFTAPEFTLTLRQDGKLIDAATGKPLDAVMKDASGKFASAVTGEVGGLVWTWKKVTLSGTRDGVSVAIYLYNVRAQANFGFDIGGNTFQLTGRAYGIPGSNNPIEFA